MHNNHPQGHAPASDLLEKLRALRAAKQQQPSQPSGFGPPPPPTSMTTGYTSSSSTVPSSYNQPQQWPPAVALPSHHHRQPSSLQHSHHQSSYSQQHQGQQHHEPQAIPQSNSNPSIPQHRSSSQILAPNNNHHTNHHIHQQSLHQKSLSSIINNTAVHNAMETPHRGPFTSVGASEDAPTPWSAAGTPSVGGGGSSSRQPMTPDAHAAHAAARVNRNVQRWAALGTTIPSFVTQPKPPSLNVITHVSTTSSMPSASAARASNPSATAAPSLLRVSTAPPISLDDDDEGVDLFEPNYDVAPRTSSATRISVEGASASAPPNSFLQQMQALSSRVQDAKHQQFLSEIARKPSTSSGGRGGGGRGGFGSGRGGGWKRGRENEDTQDDEADNSKSAPSKSSITAKRPSPKTSGSKSAPPATNNPSTPSTVAPSAPITKTFLYRPGSSSNGAAGGEGPGGSDASVNNNPLFGTNINSLLHTPFSIPSSDACNAVLFKEIQRQIDDPERIQAPCVCIALDIRPLSWGADNNNNSRLQPAGNNKTVTCADTMTHSNFSISAESGARLLGGNLLAGSEEGEECRVPVSHSHKAIKGCWVMLENSRAGGVVVSPPGNNSPCMFYIPDGETAISFLFTIFEKYEGVEVVTFNASCITMSMLSYSQHLHSRSASPSPSSSPPIPTSTTTSAGRYFATSCLSDVRTMGWMLSPNQPWSDFDSLFLSMSVPMSSITLPHTATTGSSFSNSAVMKLLGEHSSTSQKGISLRLQLTLPLYRKLYGSLGTQGLLQAFLKTEKLVGILCASMKYNGCCVDTSIVEVQRHTAEARMEQLKIDALKHVPSHMHETFNIQSTEDIRVVLYEHLELKTILLNSFANAETKGGKLSTAEDALKALTNHHPLPSIILEYRRVAKLFQTYFCGVLERGNLHEQEDHLEGATGGGGNNNGGAVSKLLKVHPNFLQEATDTGRLSCVDPNLQNLPRATELSTAALDPLYNPSSIEALATSVRRSFVAPKGYTLICIDYEQIELRVLAFLSQDKTLMDSLSSQDPEANDIHRRIASTVFQKPMTDITSSERSQAKRVVFGVLYGMGARALAAQTGMTFERATQIQNAFKKAFPTIDAYHRSVLEGCKREKMVRTILGRIRPLPEINDPSMGVRAQAERQAFNTVIQGSAADIVKRAMVQVHYNVLLPFSSGASNNTSSSGNCAEGRIPLLIGQVHDELIFAIPNTQLSTVIPQIRTAMTGCFPTLTVPLRVQVLFGPNLADLKPWSVDGDFGLLDNMSQGNANDVPWL